MDRHQLGGIIFSESRGKKKDAGKLFTRLWAAP